MEDDLDDVYPWDADDFYDPDKDEEIELFWDRQFILDAEDEF